MKRKASILMIGSILIGLAVVLLMQAHSDCYAFRGEGGVRAGPQGGEAVRGPEGGAAVRGPGGRVVAVLPDGARSVVIRGQDYFVAEGVYYQPCAGGYCVVEIPSDDTDDDN